ncbi:hypothetical protein GW17_00018276 [Ensete ventricosum]|nr:hypothetical protein GW17_00018276 [Ensete ventricosum]
MLRLLAREKKRLRPRATTRGRQWQAGEDGARARFTIPWSTTWNEQYVQVRHPTSIGKYITVYRYVPPYHVAAVHKHGPKVPIVETTYCH